MEERGTRRKKVDLRPYSPRGTQYVQRHASEREEEKREEIRALRLRTSSMSTKR